MQRPHKGISGAHGNMHDWKAAARSKWSTELEKMEEGQFHDSARHAEDTDDFPVSHAARFCDAGQNI